MKEEIEEFFYINEVEATISIIVVVLNIRVSRWIFGKEDKENSIIIKCLLLFKLLW